MRLAIELFAMAITITLGCLLLSSMITSGNQVADAREYYNVVVNRIEDSYCNEDVIRECINEAENKSYQLSVKDVTMYNDNPSKLVVLSYNVTFPILNMFNKDNKKQAVIEGYAR